MLAHRVAVTDPASEPRMMIGLYRNQSFALNLLPFKIGLPATRLKPVVGKADLRTGKTCAIGCVGLDRLQQILRVDLFLHGLFDLGKAHGFAAKAVRWVSRQNLLDRKSVV